MRISYHPNINVYINILNVLPKPLDTNSIFLAESNIADPLVDNCVAVARITQGAEIGPTICPHFRSAATRKESTFASFS